MIQQTGINSLCLLLFAKVNLFLLLYLLKVVLMEIWSTSYFVSIYPIPADNWHMECFRCFLVSLIWGLSAGGVGWGSYVNFAVVWSIAWLKVSLFWKVAKLKKKKKIYIYAIIFWLISAKSGTRARRKRIELYSSSQWRVLACWENQHWTP